VILAHWVDAMLVGDDFPKLKIENENKEIVDNSNALLHEVAK
jgi:hypothetical protein